MKVSASGFSPKRIAYAAVALGFLTIPLQFADNWRVGEAGFWFAVSLVFIAGLFCLMQPRTTPKRFYPVVWLLVAVIAHMFLAHL